MGLKRFVAVLICILLVVSAFAGCAKKKEGKVIVELHEVTRSVFYAPQYVAASLGYFDEEGLDVRITTSGGSDKAMTALLAGEADICLAGPETGVYVCNEGKANHPIIVGQLTKRDGSFLMGREAQDPFDWASLTGKTLIGGRKGGMPLMTLLWVLDQHGLTAGENIEVIDSIAFNMMAGAFEGGTGDFVTLFEPTATEMQNNERGFILASVGLESGSVPYTCYLVTPEKLKNAPGQVEAFLRAIHRAQLWILTATDEEIAKAMQPFFPDSSLNSLIIVANSYRQSDAWKAELEMFEEDYHRLLAIMAFSGELSAAPEFGALVNNELARKIDAG
ncbi:MAG: ABC transporter substrate-binding protein [Clostridiales bacterium]|nr:ABC transporter substrate-binding protein [Clostridiales bacterium]